MQIILSKKAQKNYKKIPKVEQKRIKEKLKALEKDSLIGKKLDAEYSEFRSLRAWPYRIIYQINKSRHQIEVAAILHRQGAYK
ncbi:MAG TPA: type II toxin-antitoxin system RelE/ParE family toxin [Candidatus Saccharimonadales bacterium]|nr:type II toxin-antitoxin system RelE/ParE family toxin [Candidatus Saccharimonadales bacterium]